jgi:Lamin Tail Domain/FG-GAP-like repeat
MKRKFALGFLSILAVMMGGIFINSASAEKLGQAENSAAVSTTLVISQVNGGGGGSTGTYLFDYVEIKNVSGTPQSLNGLSLYYGSAVGNFASTAGNAFALPNVMLNPGQYYFVQTGPTGSAGAAFPVTPDATTANLTMSGTSGKVALATSALAINTCGATATPCSAAQLGFLVDWVAYGAAGNGTAGNGEGGTATNNGAAITASQGNVRKTGGCTDTDNNNADFDVITAPVPRNTSSTATTCTPTLVTAQHTVDFNGDGKSDFAVVRNTGGGPSGQITWFINLTGTGTTYASQWGVSGDFYTPVDFDGDNKSDIAIWRAGAPTVARFYILQSATNTLRIEAFGQTGDDPSVVDDYDGDGKADPAVYRAGANAGDQSTWYYRGSLNNPSGNVTFIPWGQNGDFPAPGDYDGDGKNDFVIQRNNGGGQARFWMSQTTAGFNSIVFGTPTDVIVPGDYDGDGKTDLATIRGSGGQINWYVRPSSTGTISGGPTAIFGASATDFPTQGDYDGDGKTDFAIWRPSATPGASTFWVLGSTTGAFSVPFGQNGDYPVARYNGH